MTLTEMQGLLRGQCLPGDLKVGEELAEYFVRQFKERDDKISALAADNAVLKKFCKNASFDADYAAELGMERGGFTDAMNDIKTPATDAAIAEIKARVWIEAKDLTKSMLATDSVDHLDFLFDGKIEQLRKESGQ